MTKGARVLVAPDKLRLGGVSSGSDPGFLDVLPPQMRDPVLFAIPFFLLLLIIEWTAARKLEHLEDADRPPIGRVPPA